MRKRKANKNLRLTNGLRFTISDGFMDELPLLEDDEPSQGATQRGAKETLLYKKDVNSKTRSKEENGKI